MPVSNVTRVRRLGFSKIIARVCRPADALALASLEIGLPAAQRRRASTRRRRALRQRDEVDLAHDGHSCSDRASRREHPAEDREAFVDLCVGDHQRRRDAQHAVGGHVQQQSMLERGRGDRLWRAPDRFNTTPSSRPMPRTCSIWSGCFFCSVESRRGACPPLHGHAAASAVQSTSSVATAGWAALVRVALPPKVDPCAPRSSPRPRARLHHGTKPERRCRRLRRRHDVGRRPSAHYAHSVPVRTTSRSAPRRTSAAGRGGRRSGAARRGIRPAALTPSPEPGRPGSRPSAGPIAASIAARVARTGRSGSPAATARSRAAPSLLSGRRDGRERCGRGTETERGQRTLKRPPRAP